MDTSIFFAALASLAVTPSASTSYYPVRLDDAKAVYVTADKFRVKGDGVADDTAAIQKAIDQVQEKRGSGIVFLPSGRYRLTSTLCIWAGIRVIGYGSTRPTLFLAPNTPGYQKAERQMVFFAGGREKKKADFDHPEVSGPNGLSMYYDADANPGTFYSAMSNVNIEIGEGNPGAVGVRGRYAQHCYLAHMDFHLGSALAGIHDTGNLAEDLRFYGGKSGIITRTPSPGWPFTLMDSVFEGQTEAAIRTYETGLTLIRPTFRNVPTAVAVEPGQTEQLWISDARLESVSGPALEISREHSLRTQISLQNVDCLHVPTFAAFRESGDRISGLGEIYKVKSLTHGLQFADPNAEGEVKTVFEGEPLSALPPAVKTDIATLPPADTWANLASLGAKGDGESDDTAILKAAIAKYRTIYLPSGKYRVTETIHLKPDTVLIGLHPFATQILIKDETPAFEGAPEKPNTDPWDPPKVAFPGAPVPLIEAPKGGTNIVSGIGLDTGGNNPAATAARWMAGKDSMIEDVKFLGGHGSVEWSKIYNANHSGDPDPKRRWDSQYPSLWVTDGGGGTFKNIWTASTFASAGMAITNTNTEGRVYELSTEHHVRHEVQIRNATNWSLYGLQAEEERGEGPFALPLDIDASSNILVANLNIYRVISMWQPFPYAVRVADCKDVQFRNVHCGSNSKVSFDSLLFDAATARDLRQREFASLNVGVSGTRIHRPLAPETLADGAKVEKLAGGFFNISGGAVDGQGNFYFVDAHFHRIYRWNVAGGGTSVVQDTPLYPTNLFFDKSGNLVVVSYAGKGAVYTFRPGADDVTLLKPEPAVARPAATPVFAVTDWTIDGDLRAGKPLKKAFHFVSPDGTTYLPVAQDFLDGAMSWGVKDQDVLRSFGLAKAEPGKPFYVMGEADLQTYVATVESDGTLSHAKLFAEQGGEGLAVDPAGNVYIGAGQIFVYDPSGRMLGTIEVPERPIQLAFGGPDGKTLFIAARTSLYSVRIR